MFESNEIAILSDKCIGLPDKIGEKCSILGKRQFSPMYQYDVEFDDGTILPVRETELNKLTEQDKRYMDYIYTGNEVLHSSDVKVKIIKVDYLNRQTEVEFLDDGLNFIVTFDSLRSIDEDVSDDTKSGKFTEIALEIGKFTDEKNKQYGSSVDATYEMMKVLMERYTYDDENYLMPKSLLQHLLLQVRMMDKQNRIFNNPSGKGDSESPYKDLCGYSLIGIDMVINK